MCVLIEDTDSDSPISSGKSFQSPVALTAKALSLLVVRQDSEMDRRPLPEDCKVFIKVCIGL